jgi:signal peptidase II
LLVVFFDQLSKISVKSYWLENKFTINKINIVGDYLRITFLENPGIAFGIDTSKYHFFITILTFLIIFILFYHLISLIKINDKEALPMSFVIGGAIGNSIDRLLVLIPSTDYRGVIDFIDIGINHHRWYIFNIADASITIGLFILLYQAFQRKNI